MKYLQIYENFDEIDNICIKYRIHDYTINQDGSINVDNEVNINNKYLLKLPLNFSKVNGNFDCSENKLVSLKGSPIEITKGFYATFNKLTSLENGPKKVSLRYWVQNNNLRDMYGFPEHFDGEVYTFKNPIQEIIRLC